MVLIGCFAIAGIKTTTVNMVNAHVWYALLYDQFDLIVGRASYLQVQVLPGRLITLNINPPFRDLEAKGCPTILPI